MAFYGTNYKLWSKSNTLIYFDKTHWTLNANHCNQNFYFQRWRCWKFCHWLLEMAIIISRHTHKITTLSANTLMPVQREILLSCGISSASENSLKTLLNWLIGVKNGRIHDGCTSTAVGLVGGGMRESRLICPNTDWCVVAKRRGFVRVAIETGASLVPAISFGENNLYKNVEIKSPFWRNICKSLPMISNGRGFLQYNFGLLPIRQPVATVIGAPIHVKKVQNPSRDLLDKYHETFCDKLIELFETHKQNYMENSDQVHLELCWARSTPNVIKIYADRKAK